MAVASLEELAKHVRGEMYGTPPPPGYHSVAQITNKAGMKCKKSVAAWLGKEFKEGRMARVMQKQGQGVWCYYYKRI